MTRLLVTLLDAAGHGCRWLGLLVVLACSACAPEDEGALPESLTIGVLPDQNEEVLKHRYAPMIAYLEQSLETGVSLVVADGYDDLVRRFGAGELDLAQFGGTTFLSAASRYGAVPLAMRDIDARFSSYFLARAEDPARVLEDFQGRRLSFGSTRSTSGHLMPRYFLKERGIIAESFFAEIAYAGTHDKTVASILDGHVDLGAANSEVVEAMMRDGRVRQGALRIVWETPPYADYVWAGRADLGTNVLARLRDAFLALSPLDPAQAEVLARLGAGGYLPARVEDFARLREVTTSLPRFSDMLAAEPQR